MRRSALRQQPSTLLRGALIFRIGALASLFVAAVYLVLFLQHDLRAAPEHQHTELPSSTGTPVSDQDVERPDVAALTSVAPPAPPCDGGSRPVKGPFVLPALLDEIEPLEPEASLDSFYPRFPTPPMSPLCKNIIYSYSLGDGERVVSDVPIPELEWRSPLFHLKRIQVREAVSGSSHERLILFGTMCTNSRTGAPAGCPAPICSLRVLDEAKRAYMAVPVRGEAFQTAMPRQQVLAAVVPASVERFYVRVGIPGNPDATWSVDLNAGRAGRRGTPAGERLESDLESITDPRDGLDLELLWRHKGYGFQAQESCVRIVSSRMAGIAARKARARKAEDRHPIVAKVAALGEEHGIELVVHEHSRSLPMLRSNDILSPPKLEEVDRLLPVLTRALEQYPPGFLERLTPGPIVLVSELSREKEPLSGLAYWPNSPFENTFLNVGELNAREPHLAAATIHHEIFHLIQHREEARDVLFGWALLNPPETRYVGARWRELSGIQRGMVSRYASVSAREDQAETFAHAMALPTLLGVRLRMDSHLEAKVGKLKKALIAVDPRGEPSFWQGILDRPSSLVSR